MSRLLPGSVHSASAPWLLPLHHFTRQHCSAVPPAAYHFASAPMDTAGGALVSCLLPSSTKTASAPENTAGGAQASSPLPSTMQSASA